MMDLTAVIRLRDQVTTPLRSISGQLTALVGTVGIVATAMDSLNTAMDFEAQMSKVGAIADATGDDLNRLKDTAVQLGAETTKSASEVAQSMQELAAKGFDTNKIIGAMPGIIKAAEASGEDLALTSDVVTSALNAFNMEAEQASHIADVMAMAANETAAGINDMGYAFKYAAPVANSLGISMEELASATGLMVDKGLEGSQAGTALRMGLTRLADAPKEASEAMNAMGFSAVDSANKFKSIAQITDELRKKMDGMTQAQKVQTLSTIFGVEAATGWLGLIDSAPGKLDNLTNALKKSDGAAEAAANKMMDNAKGAIEQMMGAFESVQIAVMTPVLPLVKQIATEIGNFASNIKPEQFTAFGNSIKNGLETAYEIVKSFAKFVYDNWTTISNVVLAAGTAFVTFKTLLLGITAAQAVVQVIGALRAVITGVTAVQWGWNAALLANPLTWIVAGITAVVAAGVLLWRNWDIVKAKTSELWNRLGGFPGIASKVIGPIGIIITVAKKMAGQWDTVKVKVGNAMDSARAKVNAFFKPLLSFIGKAKDKWDSFTSIIRNFKMPKLKFPSLPSWMTGGGGSEKVDGSAYHGADRIARDGMLYRVHKNEAILPAKQANVWRQIKGLIDGGSPIKSAPYKKAGSQFEGVKYDQVLNVNVRTKGTNSHDQQPQVHKIASSGDSGSTVNQYFTITYNGGAANEQEFEKFAEYLNRRLGQAMAGGA